MLSQHQRLLSSAVEHSPCKRAVNGSIPLGGSFEKAPTQMMWSEPFSWGCSVPQCTLSTVIDGIPPIEADSVQSVAGQRRRHFRGVWSV